ncbi:hypothetical protein D3C87_2013780 [compost metagenome]
MESENLVFIKAQILVIDILDLPVDNARAGDHHDGGRKLEYHQRLPESRAARLAAQLPFQCDNRAVTREH